MNLENYEMHITKYLDYREDLSAFNDLPESVEDGDDIPLDITAQSRQTMWNEWRESASGGE